MSADSNADMEIVRRMLREKLDSQNVPAADIEFVLQGQDKLREALEFFRNYGDFKVVCFPGDGDGLGDRLLSFGGNVNVQMFVYPP